MNEWPSLEQHPSLSLREKSINMFRLLIAHQTKKRHRTLISLTCLSSFSTSISESHSIFFLYQYSMWMVNISVFRHKREINDPHYPACCHIISGQQPTTTTTKKKNEWLLVWYLGHRMQSTENEVKSLFRIILNSNE